MKKMLESSNGLPIRWLVASYAMAMLLLLPRAGFSQQAAISSGLDTPVPLSSLMPGVVPSRPAASRNGEEEELPKPNTAGHQGVRVHGHWVLQLKNADGTLGERREFENSLVTDDVLASGDQYLVGLISGNIAPSDPGIAFIPCASAAACASTPPSSRSCPIGQATPVGSNLWTGCYVFTTDESLFEAQGLNPYIIYLPTTSGLVITSNFGPSASPSTAPVNWVLSGNYLVPLGLTSIGAVQTLMSYCIPKSASYFDNSGDPNKLAGTSGDRNADYSSKQCQASASPSATDGFGFATLTSTLVTSGGVPTPLTVTPGQYIAVSVTISFS